MQLFSFVHTYNILTLKFGEKYLLALSLFALSRSFFVNVRIKYSLSLSERSVLKIPSSSWSATRLPFSTLSEFSSSPMKNVFTQKWNILSWGRKNTENKLALVFTNGTLIRLLSASGQKQICNIRQNLFGQQYVICYIACKDISTTSPGQHTKICIHQAQF